MSGNSNLSHITKSRNLFPFGLSMSGLKVIASSFPQFVSSSHTSRDPDFKFAERTEPNLFALGEIFSFIHLDFCLGYLLG